MGPEQCGRGRQRVRRHRIRENAIIQQLMQSTNTLCEQLSQLTGENLYLQVSSHLDADTGRSSLNQSGGQ